MGGVAATFTMKATAGQKVTKGPIFRTYGARLVRSENYIKKEELQCEKRRERIYLRRNLPIQRRKRDTEGNVLLKEP